MRDAGRTLPRSVTSSWSTWSAAGLGAAALLVGCLVVYTVVLDNPSPTTGASSATVGDASPSATFTPSNRAADVAWLGDSYSVGAGGTLGGFVAAVSQARDWDSQNLGVGGTGYVVRAERAVTEAQDVCGRDYCPAFPEEIEDAAEMHGQTYR